MAFGLLFACKFVLSPITSGYLEIYGSGAPVQKTRLTEAQLSVLSDFFRDHQSGWSSSPASFVPAVLVRVTHKNGDVSTINLLRSMLVISNQEGQYVTQLPAEDMAKLRTILGAPKI